MNMPISRRLFTALCLVFFAAVSGAQTITTADSFFSSVSDTYAKINDYSSSIAISYGQNSRKDTMTGHAVFKVPNLLRIDFTNPAEQVIVFNGDQLTIYLPTYNVILNQSVEKGSGSSGASLATPQGLTLMKRYYSVAYETGSTPVALEENSQEQVVILLLSRKTTTEMFRTIRLMISPDTNLIRRIDALTISGDHVQFDFTGYALNQGVLDNRFVYDSPASANIFNDFLFNQ
jgi:outer membrane lipoprotein-sorting protein